MKQYRKLVIFFASAAAIVLVVFLARTLLSPMSAMIAKERDKLARSLDRNRAGKDPAYAREMEEALQRMDYRLALAYNREEKPDKAIEVLRKLIDGEEAKEKSGIQRHSRSFFDEARWFEALAESCELKNDAVGAGAARKSRGELTAKGEELAKQETRGEGTSVRLKAD